MIQVGGYHLAAGAGQIGDILVEKGLVSADELKTALNLQKESREKIGRILCELGYISEKDLLQELSAVGIGFSDLHTTQRSLEDIFVSLVAEPASAPQRVGEAS